MRRRSGEDAGASPATDRIKVADVELGVPPESLGNVDGYQALRAMVRVHGVPIGYVEVPLFGARFTGADLRRVILRRLAFPVIRHHLIDLLQTPLQPDGLDVERLLDAPHPAPGGASRLITIAVCTRDRPEDLKLCLDSLLRQDHPRLDILVVDNAPTTDATESLIEDSYPEVRYVREPRPGLDWARNRAIAEAHGEIIAYTDDDVVADPGWAAALAAAFEDPQVMAVTGLVWPHELETEAQILFERYGGFSRGFRRRYWRMDRESGEGSFGYIGAGQYGTGANMAYRLSVFEHVGPFDRALDVGTVTNGGGDLEMFFRVLKEGYLLAYEPAAIIRHRHRRGYAQLRTQIANNGVGFYSHLVRTGLMYPDTRTEAARFGLWWFWKHSLRRLAESFVPVRRLVASPIRKPRFPRDLILAELRGSLIGLGRYQKARRRATRIASSFGDGGTPVVAPVPAPAQKPAARKGATVGVRTVDLCQPLRGLDDVAEHAGVRVFVTLDGRPIGDADIANHHQPVSAARLREAIVDHLDLRLLGQDPELSPEALWENARAALRQHYLTAATDGAMGTSARLPDDIPVSIVVATYDRPDDLRGCLRCLTAQESARPIEIVVVDNNPSSGLTPPVVAEFPRVVLVTETRQGLSYARNRGFTASRGEIVAATDDDVLMPPDWLEKLVAPFVRSDVMVVTGNVFPLELETPAQRYFERYGGLGRGFVPKEADGKWFDSFRRGAVPTWDLGATANAAFRASIFAHPEIGLIDETLGAGTPTGCSEDTYLFYKVLKAGFTVFYEPSAYVWHRHRREMSALRNQLYNYSKGHVAYHLTTLLRDRDPRVVRYLAVRLPKMQLRGLLAHFKGRVLRRNRYPLVLLLLEIKGNLAGPWSLWRSYRRVKREGRSDPYSPVSQRAAVESRQQAIRSDT
jgi:O-antigen biosynthesis protein